LRIPLRVDCGEVPPVRREFLARKNRRRWAHRNAGTAINAFCRVYIKMGHPGKFRFVSSGMYAVARTNVDAGSVFHIRTWLRNYKGHKLSVSGWRRQQPTSSSFLLFATMT
jgi:hypothetical protein